MLLIGSRAIRFYFPEFREPRDWDLVATQTEIDELARRLPLAGPQSPDKAHFECEGRLVEVANASVLPYWAQVLKRFSRGPELRDPKLGTLSVAPPAYLLLTKHCGLVYRVVHWHKNLEDLYFLRERVTTVPPEVADLATDTVSDSARMFARSHERTNTECLTCHPQRASEQSHHTRALHDELHRRLQISERAARDQVGAWQGFPHVSPEQRTRFLQLLFAEEAMVLAAQARLRSPLSGQNRSQDEWLRWALRTLCIGELPVGLRYFVVNYYQEIRNLLRDDWYERVADLAGESAAGFRCCESDEQLCDGRVGQEDGQSQVTLS